MAKLGLARLVPHLGRLARGTRWRRTRGRPRVWAHRGDSAHAPENTMLAFEKAKAAGADGLEYDVRLDGEDNVVVFHDSKLERLVGQPGTMEALSAAERARLRVGGEPVPLLAEVLDAFDLEHDVEIKINDPGRGGALVEAVARVIKRARKGVIDRTLISSFDPLALVQFHRHLPDLALAHVFHGEQLLPLRRGWAATAVGASLVHPHHGLCDEDTVRRWHSAGMAINAWTVDDPEELARLARLGIDGVFANDPAHALAVFASL